MWVGGALITPSHPPLAPLSTFLVLQFSQKKLLEGSLPLVQSEDIGKDNTARGSMSHTISSFLSSRTEQLFFLGAPSSTMFLPRWGHTHIVKTFVKDEVPVTNGFQPLDDVGAPKS